jgi:hypothetical protein
MDLRLWQVCRAEQNNAARDDDDYDDNDNNYKNCPTNVC